MPVIIPAQVAPQRSNTPTQTPMPSKEISRPFSFIAGIIVNSALVFLLWSFPLPYWLNFNPVRILVMITSLIYFGYWGLRMIDVGYRGVLLIFGERRESLIFKEGYYWIFPYPFMDIDAIDVREDIIEVSNFEAITKDNFRVRVASAAIRFKIANPFKSLSIKIDVIKGSFDELVGNVLRVSIRKENMDKVLGEFEDGKKDLEQAATDISKDWGIEIVDIIVAPITLPEEVIKDLEKVGREKIQKEGEKIELDSLRERTKEFVTDPDLHFSPQEAREAVQIGQGKITKTIREEKITLSQETAALLANTMEKIFGKTEVQQKEEPLEKPPEKQGEDIVQKIAGVNQSASEKPASSKGE